MCRVFNLYHWYLFIFKKKQNKQTISLFFAANFTGGDSGGVLANQITVYHSLTSDHPPTLHEYRMVPALDKDRSSLS